MATQTPGIDVSHYQGNITWASVKAAGAGFAFAKATEGTSSEDAMFAANWPAIRSAGLLRGAYHFFRASQDCVAQANFFLSVADFAPGDLPPVLDVETADGVTSEVLQSGVQSWLNTVAAKTGVVPIIYTAPSFWNQYFTPQFGSYPLWIANYGVQSPTLPAGWNSWQFWQYSQSGNIAGVSGAVDLDYFNGSVSQLLSFSNSPGVPAGTAPTMPSPAQTYTVQSGDTLSGIAQKFGVTVSALASANNIPNPDVIQAGQVLQIPQAG